MQNADTLVLRLCNEEIVGRAGRPTQIRWLVGFGGTAAVLGSLLALAMPLNLGQVDRKGVAIRCGTGLRPDTSIALREDGLNRRERDRFGAMFVASDYVSECADLVRLRRSTALPVSAGGAIAVIGALGAVGTLRRSGRSAQDLREPMTADGQVSSSVSVRLLSYREFQAAAGRRLEVRNGQTR